MSSPIATVREMRAEALHRRLAGAFEPVSLSKLMAGRRQLGWTADQVDDAINDLVEEGRVRLVFTGVAQLCPGIEAVS